METNQSKKVNNTLLFLSGAIVGAATAYFFSTPRGKELGNQVVNATSDVAESISEKTSNLTAIVKDKAREAAEYTSDKMHEIKEGAIQTGEAVAGEVEDSLSSFKKGVNKAKSNIQDTDLDIQKA